MSASASSGPSRGREAQRGDIAAGRDLLDAMLGDLVEPIFTPPWNRCTVATGSCLGELGFEVLSREAKAEPLGAAGLRELPVSLDWLKKIERGGPVGVMLHHAGMDGADLEAAGELLAVLAEHERTTCLRMRDVG